MEFFLTQIRTILPVLSMGFLREKPPINIASPKVADIEQEDKLSPVFELAIRKEGITAYAQEVGGEFVVAKDSETRTKWIGSGKGYKPLFEQLIADDVLGGGKNERRLFLSDFAFASPSAAAAIILGRPANGRTEWRIKGDGRTYAEWQEAEINQDNIGNHPSEESSA